MPLVLANSGEEHSMKRIGGHLTAHIKESRVAGSREMAWKIMI